MMAQTSEDKAPAAAPVEPPVPLWVHCSICNNKIPVENLGAPGRICSSCGATRQSIELAAAMMATIGLGVHPFLNRLAFEAPLRSARVLDLSGDLTLGQTMWVVDEYKAGRAVAQVPDGHTLSRFDPVDIGALEPGSCDLLMVRDLLFAAPDLGETLDAVSRLLAKGGWVLVQDRFGWPVPPETQYAAAGDDEAPTMRALGGGLSAQVHQTIGADIVDMLAARDMLGEFHRINLGLDPLYRNVLLVAQKH